MATGSQSPPPFQVLTESLLNLPETIFANTALTQLPRFAGKSQEFQNWILELERYFIIHNCDENRKIKVTFQSSAGPVCEFLKRYLTDNNSVRYEQLKAKLRSRYGEITDPQYALKLLRNVRQRQGENIATYGERILMLAKDACEGDLDVANPMQRVLIGQFTDGLISDAVRAKLIRGNPATLSDAVNLALREQNFLKRIHNRTHHSDDNTASHEPMEVDHARPTRKCTNCGRKNHETKDCRAVRAISQNSDEQTLVV